MSIHSPISRPRPPADTEKTDAIQDLERHGMLSLEPRGLDPLDILADGRADFGTDDVPAEPRRRRIG